MLGRCAAPGLFAPTFLVGALVGRVYYIFVDYLTTSIVPINGTNATTILPTVSLPWTANYQGGEYAVIGAAALTGGITRAVSTVRFAAHGWVACSFHAWNGQTVCTQGYCCEDGCWQGASWAPLTRRLRRCPPPLLRLPCLWSVPWFIERLD